MPTDPAHAIVGLRAEIDEIDRRLAELLQRRAELTASVQRHKLAQQPATGEVAWPPPRDPEREREIAETMALGAPALGPRRLARIMDVVISESIDAGAEGRRRSGPPVA